MSKGAKWGGTPSRGQAGLAAGPHFFGMGAHVLEDVTSFFAAAAAVRLAFVGDEVRKPLRDAIVNAPPRLLYGVERQPQAARDLGIALIQQRVDENPLLGRGEPDLRRGRVEQRRERVDDARLNPRAAQGEQVE